MINIECKKCGSKFYSASPDFVKKCPYCKAGLLTSTPLRRKEERAEIMKDCLLIKGSLKVNATATDISHTGVGIRIKDVTPLNINDSIHITIKELDIDSDAKVVWVKQADGYRTETGLIFNAQ